MRICFVTTEAVPFAKTGGLADVCGALPLALSALGHEVFVIMPHYRLVGPRPALNDLAFQDRIAGDVPVYFIKGPKFFDREGVYGTSRGDYEDSLERFAYFSHQTMKFLKTLGQPVDIVHCHDWPTALVPLLIRENYREDPFFKGTRSVFTIHNLAYQGIFPAEQFPALDISRHLFNERQLEFYEKINFLKAGIVFADRLTTVSPSYAHEILTPELGCGLDGVLRMRQQALSGILNGLDEEFWNPATDRYLPSVFDPDHLERRVELKARLRDEARLPDAGDVPLFGFVGRLFAQKGLDLIEDAAEELARRPLQMVFLGVGEERYQRMLLGLSRRHPRHMAVLTRYDEPCAHLVYGGADFFLMPSVYEPCGLTQMIAMKYGAVPVASNVGGLSDTVGDVTLDPARGNGFLMGSYSIAGLMEAVDRACGYRHHTASMRELVLRCMRHRWSWREAALKYETCYRACFPEPGEIEGK